MPIIRKDSAWTTIQCQNCNDCHKVLSDKHMRAVLCPYCGTTIMLKEGSTPKVDSAESLTKLNEAVAGDPLPGICFHK